MTNTKPSIVILNSSSFGKHHPDHIAQLEQFATLRAVTVPQDISGEELVPHLRGAHGIIASVSPKIPGVTMSALPELRLIARHGIGCDNVDLAAAAELGIWVSKVAGPVEQDAVAELAVGLMLAGGRYVAQGAQAVAQDKWKDRANFVGLELRGKRVGLIGLGNIGTRVAEILSAGFRSEVVAFDPLLSATEIRRRGASPMELDDLLKTSDVVSFHCLLTNSTRRILNSERMAMMKRGSVLVNTCRGELLDEDALFNALSDGHLRFYATDVVEGEPIDSSHRLLACHNVLVLPHLGGYTAESLRGMGDTMVQDCRAVFVERCQPGIIANLEILKHGAIRPWV